jgi:hypothetical protein
MTFGQTTIGNTTFKLNGTDNGFSVSVNPGNVMNAKQFGVATITFDPAVDFVSMDNYVASGIAGGVDGIITEIKSSNGATNAIQFNYEDMGYGTVYITTNTSTVFNCFIENDTIDAFYNGLASAPECVQDFTQADIDQAFIDGILSVNIDSAFQAGVEYGQNSTDIVDFVIDNTLSVYPNSVTQGQDVNINCFDFNKVDVYNTVGQIVHTSTSPTLSTSTLETGLYVLIISDFNGNVIVDSNNKTTKLIVR